MANANQVQSKNEDGCVNVKGLTAHGVGDRNGPNRHALADWQQWFLLVRVNISVLEA